MLTDIFPTYQDWIDNLETMRKHERSRTGPNVAQWLQRYGPTQEEICALPGYNGDVAIPEAPESSEHASKPHAFPVNLNIEPQWLIDRSMVYVGRDNTRLSLRRSHLCNPHRMQGKSQAERDRVCNEHIETLILCLKAQKGDTWDEVKRLALLVRRGGSVPLGCYCVPKRCHGEAIALVVNMLAARRKVSTIIAALRELKTVEQSELLTV